MMKTFFCNLLILGLMIFINPLQALSEEHDTSLEAGRTFQDCVDCPEMVVIPPGNFIMGMSDGRKIDSPAHKVTFDKPFAVGVYPVTINQFRQFMNKNPDYNTISHCTDYGEQGKSSNVKGRTWDNTGFSQGEDHPVVCLNWYDMQVYLKWLNQKTGKTYRLLSEAEWEYFARSKNKDSEFLRALATHDHGNFGAPYEECCKGAIRGADEWLYTSPVNAFPSNDFGVYGMNGNVEVLLLDCVNADYVGAPDDGSAWTASTRTGHEDARDWATTDGQCLARIYRGQAWKFPPAKNWFARRYPWSPNFGSTFIGFRVALDLDE